MDGIVSYIYSNGATEEAVMFFKQKWAKEENREGLKIAYDDVAPYAKDYATVQILEPGLKPHVGLKPHAGLKPKASEILKILSDLNRDDVVYPGYALGYDNFSILNGQYINYPSNPLPYGYISEEISNDQGEFGYAKNRVGLKPKNGLKPKMFLYPSNTVTENIGIPTLTIDFSQKFTSVGVTLTFNELSGDYCPKVNIKWFSDGETLSDMDFEPNDTKYFCNNYVQNYNKIVVTFKKTSKPRRPVFLTRIDYGIYREFLDDEILETSCLQEINAISENISINTLSFTVRTRSSVPFDLQKKQKLSLYFNGNLLGDFYLKNGARKTKTDYYMDTHDALGVLDGSEFPGGVYTGRTVGAVLGDIFDGEDFVYLLDSSFENIPLYGYIPYTTKRNALVQIAFAIGAVVDTSNFGGVVIYPQETEKTGEFSENETFMGVSLEHVDIVTGIRLTVHSYQQSTEEQELYNGELNGTAEVIFSEPYHSLSVTGGTLNAYGDNYAYITGSGGIVKLTGKRYNHLTSTVVKENPLIPFNKNIKEIVDATLVYEGNANEVLNRVYDYYQRAENIVGDVLTGDKKVGQVVEIDTGYDGTRLGTIESFNYSFSRNEMRAEVKIHE